MEEVYRDVRAGRRRTKDLIHRHRTAFDSSADTFLFSAPGRTELGGNHTDHNLGKVLASAVQLDSLAVVTPTDSHTVRLNSHGFDGTFVVNLDNLEKVDFESGTSSALIRGVAAGISREGGEIGGFNATVESLVLPGSGLSSSASFEILVATIMNELFNAGRLSTVQLSKIAQAAENHYFDKPCGLMDQLACSTGGIIEIDFADPENPDIRSLDYSFRDHGLELLVVDTGGNHADLTPDYAAVPAEMQAVARFFGRRTLRGVTVDDVLANVRALREEVHDRGILRALHFFTENDRVDEMVTALTNGELPRYLDLVSASGDSSWELLQNCYTTQEPQVQGITTALAVTRQFLSRRSLQGACRVHGGGFAGTIQAYIPTDALGAYTKLIEGIFGAGVATPLSVRSLGAVRLANGRNHS